MSSQHWSYDLLKELVSRKTVSPEEFEEIKNSFADEIGSPRRLSCIRTLEDLLDILERRDELSENNIEPLNDLGEYFNDNEVNDVLSQYNAPEEIDDYENEYALERIESESQERLRINGRINGSEFSECHDSAGLYNPAATAARIPNNPVASCQFGGNKRELIYKLISTEIGRRWRDFGREIGIREGEMDNLESDYPRNSKLKIRKMLEMYEEEQREDPKRIVLRICTALTNCRRPDLDQKVQEIMIR